MVQRHGTPPDVTVSVGFGAGVRLGWAFGNGSVGVPRPSTTTSHCTDAVVLCHDDLSTCYNTSSITVVGNTVNATVGVGGAANAHGQGLWDAVTTVVVMGQAGSTHNASCVLVDTVTGMAVLTSAIRLGPDKVARAPTVPTEDKRNSGTGVQHPPLPLAPVRDRSNFATPIMGWNHWNAFHCDIDEHLVMV